MNKIIILAGDREQFEYYLGKNGLTEFEAVYGYCPEVIMGIQAKEFIEIGTFYKRKDAYELRRLAKARVLRPSINNG